jgi:hypothetical protein
MTCPVFTGTSLQGDSEVLADADASPWRIGIDVLAVPLAVVMKHREEIEDPELRLAGLEGEFASRDRF